MVSQKRLEAAVVLKGATDPSLSAAFKRASKLSESHLKTLKKAGQTAAKIAKTAAVATASGLAYSAKAAIDYESAFAGVMKTVDETATTSYEDLSNSIRQMAKEMPASATEIAKVAETAGQLGIKADDITKFSKVMIDLGETTNLASDEAASAIAKFFNVTGTSMDNVDRFGATLVHLGNNAATTEADIMEMASYISGTGTTIGLTSQEILGLSTTLSSVGIAAERGGSAISTILTQIDKEVALNGSQLETWASVAGMSASQFKNAWQKDTMGTIQKVISGLGDAKKGGTNLNVILEDLGVKNIRTSDTMKRLANASGLLGDMTNIANTAWDENTALTTEAQKRYNTMASKLQILKNRINDAAITIGNKLMPVIESVTKKISEYDWEAFGEKVCNVIQWVVDHFKLLKGIVVVVASAFVAFKITSFILGIIEAIKIIQMFTKAFGVMNTVMSMNIIGLIVAVIAALVAGFIYAWHNCEGFRQFLEDLGNGIINITKIVVNAIKNFFTVTIPNAFNAVVNFFKSGIQKIKTFFVNLGTSIKNGFMTVVNFVKSLPSRIWSSLLAVIANIIAWKNNMIAKAKEVGLNFINAVVTFFQQLPYKIGYFIGVCIGKVILFGQKLWNFATVTIPNFIKSVGQWFSQLPGKIWTWLVSAYNKVVTWGANTITAARIKISQFINTVVTFFKQLPGKVWTWLSNTIQKVVSWGSKLVSTAKAKATQFLNTVVNFFRQLPSKVSTWLTNTVQKVISWGSNLVAKGKAAAVNFFNAVVNKIKEIPGKMLSIGKDIVTGIWNGIKNGASWLKGKIKDFATGIVDGIKDTLKIKSPSKIMERLAKWIPKGLGVGVVKNAKYAVNAIKGMGEKVTATASKYCPTITTAVTNADGKIPKHGTGGTFTNPHTAIVGDKPETIVPHGNTPRNRGLLAEAAKGVGASVGSKVFNITFAPVINGGNVNENKAMIEDKFEEFKQMMDSYFAEKGALSF